MRQFPDTGRHKKPFRLVDCGRSSQPGQLAREGIQPLVRAHLQGEHQAALGLIPTQEADQYRVHGHGTATDETTEQVEPGFCGRFLP